MDLLLNCVIFFCAFYLQSFVVNRKSLHSNNMLYIGLSFFILFVVHFFVDIHSVEDLPSYEDTFLSISQLSFIEAVTSNRTTEYVYYGLVYIVSHLNGNFRFFLFLYNVAIFFSFYYIIHKYSVDKPFSILLFLMVCYCQSIFVLRQYLAISLMLFAIPMIIQRRIVPFIFLMLLSFYIHHSSLIWLPFFFLVGIKSSKWYVVTLIFISIVFVFVSKNFAHYLALFDSDYSFYLNQYGGSRNNTKVLIQVLYLVSYIFFLGKDTLKNDFNKLITTALVILTLGYVFAPNIDLLDRMMQYYQIFIIFSIPLTVTYIKDRALKAMFVFAVVFLQGYVSVQPLYLDYYKFFKIEQQNPIYIFLIIVLTFVVCCIYKKNRKNENSYLELS